MKLLQEFVALGDKGSRKSQAFALGLAALVGGGEIGLGLWEKVGIAGLAAVYIIVRGNLDEKIVEIEPGA